ncbi:MAG: RNA polymerase sigma factor [Pseudoclavibacter sp.]
MLYDRYRVQIFRSAYRKVGSVADAEEVVAIVFLECWRLRNKVRLVEGSVLPWLLSVTTHTSLNFTRSQRRYRRMVDTLPPALDEADHAESTEERLDNSKRCDALRRALCVLSSGDRAVVNLCLVEELPQSIVARALDIPEGTVKSRLHRARRQLVRAVEADVAAERTEIDVQK